MSVSSRVLQKSTVETFPKVIDTLLQANDDDATGSQLPAAGPGHTVRPGVPASDGLSAAHPRRLDAEHFPQSRRPTARPDLALLLHRHPAAGRGGLGDARDRSRRHADLLE